MLAHLQGATLNASRLADSLGSSPTTVRRHLDVLTDLLLVRQLAAYANNTGKRLVKSPKTYIRDSGLTHALLGITNLDELLGHPVAGATWEGLVIETLIAAAGDAVQASYYRTSAGAEIDLVLELGTHRLAIEIKRSTRRS